MEEKARSKTFMKIMISLLIVISIIYIFKSGYKTGHWLYELTHQEQK